MFNANQIWTSIALFLILILTYPQQTLANDGLGNASSYNVFTLEDFTSQASESHGAMAIGGNLSISSYGAASQLESQPQSPTVVVNGNLTFENGKLYVGSALAGGSIENVTQPVFDGLEAGATIQGNSNLPINFTEEFTALSQTSNQLAQAIPTGTVEYKWGGAYLTGDCQSDVQVFDLDGLKILNSNTFALDCVPEAATIVFNVSGEISGFKNIGFDHLRNRAPKILYNFHAANQLEFTWVGIHGTVLAPFADIVNPRGQVNGTVIAKSWNGPMALYNVPFTGDLNTLLDSPNQAPEIISPPVTNVSEGQPYFYAVEAIDADGDDLIYSLVQAPDGMVISSDGLISWLPNFDSSNTYNIIIEVSDGELSAQQAYSLSILHVNQPPLAIDFSSETDEDTSVPVILTAIDLDGDILTYIIDTPPNNGTLTGSGFNLIYTPGPGFNGVDQFIYRANDGSVNSNFAAVTITVHAINDAPIAQDLNLQTDEDQALTFELPASDIDGDFLTYSIATPPSNGDITVDSGRVTYTPEPNFSGTDFFTYFVNDGELDSAVAIINITVNPINNAPIAEPLNVTTNQDTDLAIALSGTDVDSNNLFYDIETQPSNGSISGNGQNITYTPNPGFSGEDSFTYIVNDGNEDSAPAIVSIIVQPLGSCEISGAVQINYTDFSDVTDFQLNGITANLTPNADNVLRLTNGLRQGGSAFASETIPLNTDTGFLASFSTAFSFQISEPSGISDNDGQGADGIVFILQTVANNVGSIGSGIGYEGINNSLGIEFDTYNNASRDQNDGNHIGINFNGSTVSEKLVPIPQRFNDGDIHYVWIDYDGERQLLEVRLALTDTRPAEATVTAENIDLPTILGSENAFIGFSSATAAAGGQHDILNFQFINRYAPTGECGNGLPEITSTPITSQVLQPLVGNSEPVDLEPWEVIEYSDNDHEPANWVLNDDNSAIEQLINANASILLSDFNLSSGQVKGRFRVNTSIDDDFIGFVFGYQDRNNFYLFDWKQRTQSQGLIGMRVKRFSGTEQPDFWPSNPSGDAEVLYENNIGWRDRTEYEFTLNFFPGEISITVTNTETGEVIDSFTVLDDTYTSGGFGFYNFSQQQVQYQGFNLEVTSSREYIYQVEATDPDNDALTYTLIESPAGMTINEQTGEIRWFTTTDDIGEYQITIEVTDNRGGAARQSYTLVVSNDVPIITSEPIITAETGRLYVYDVDAVDPTPSDILTYSLESAPIGMTISPSSGVIEWIPNDSDVGLNSIDIKVIDLTGGFDIQSFELSVTTSTGNASPIIESIAPELAQVGFEYFYPVLASDPDSSILNYQLTIAPAGMSINTSTGLISWLPSSNQQGIYDVGVRVSDGAGGFVSQFYTVTVLTAADNTAPVINSSPITFTFIDIDYFYQINASDSDGDTLSYTLLEGPAGMNISETGLVSWFASGAPIVPVSVRVSDGAAYADQEWIISIDDGILRANLDVAPKIVDEGDTVSIKVTPGISQTPISITLTVDGIPVALDTNFAAEVITQGVGQRNVEVIVSNASMSLTLTDKFTIRDPSDIEAPVIGISTPSTGDLITAPVVVTGSIDDTNLASWRLAYQRANANSSDLTTIATGDSNQIEQALGVFDPSLLDNGQYLIVLEATDANDQASQTSVTVVVDSDLKIGNFNFSVEDLAIPLAGIPITVTRTYDSLRRNEDLDFGRGWSIDYQNFSVEESAVPSVNWRRFSQSSGTIIPFTCFEAISPRPIVSVRLPTGEVERFEAGAEPTCTFIPISIPLTFSAVGDNQSTLQALNQNSGRFENGMLVDSIIGGALNPSLYRLTSRNGYVYDLDENFGVLTITDLNGNKLTYNNSGITHSSGKSVSFVRDAQGRITQIIDPAGNAINYTYDEFGDLTSVTERDNAVTSHTYHGQNCDSDLASADCHLLDEMVDPLSRKVVRNIFDDNGRLIAQEDQNGNRTEFNYDVDGRETVVTDRNGNVTISLSDERGNVIEEIDALGHQTTYTYDDRDNLLTTTDESGNVSSTAYSEANYILSTLDALGNGFNIVSNDIGLPTQITDKSNNVTNYEYDERGNLLKTTDPEGNIAINTYNSIGLLESNTDALGNITSYTYDNQGNKLTETDALGTITRYTYNSNNKKLSETRERTIGQTLSTETTSYVYDNQDQVIQITDALGNITRKQYDLAGQEIVNIDALGRQTDMSYDVYGNLREMVYPDGSRESYTYDAENNRISQTDRLDRTITFEYDVLNRQISTTFADGSVIRREYDERGLVVANIDENGNRTNYEYDPMRRRTSEVDALSNTLSTSYSVMDDVLSMTDPLSNVTTYSYNKIGQRIGTVFADSSSSIESHDGLDRQTRMIDQEGNQKSFNYDALGRLLTVTDALGQVTRYSYDEQGNKLTETDVKGRTTSWTYDALDRVSSRTLPMGQQEYFVYDAMGNKIEHTDFNGNTHHYRYDVNDRLIETNFADGRSETNSYDAEGNRRSASISDADGVRTWNYSYDQRNRLIKEEKPDGSSLDYRYDAVGNKIEMVISTVTGVGTERYAYDEVNRLLQVVDTNNQLTSYVYDAAGNRRNMTLPNGNSTQYEFDALNQLVGIETTDQLGSLVLSYDYTLDLAGNRLQTIEASGRMTEYVYDDLYRLTTETITDGINGNYNAIHSYDEANNKVSSIINGESTAYLYDDNDRISESGDSIYTYDDNGNTLTENDNGVLKSYSYNSQNQLIQLDDGVDTTTYQYDAEGIRMNQSTAGLSKDYVIDHNRPFAQVIQETSGAESISYTYGDDLVSQHNETSSYYYHYDGLGSTRGLSNATGQLTDSYDFSAYGEVLNKTGSTNNHYLFAGEQFDQTLNKYYLRARLYNPVTGRFTQMDSWMGELQEPISLNKYLYAHANPSNNIDPSGLTIFIIGVTSQRKLTEELVEEVVDIYHAVVSGVRGEFDGPDEALLLQTKPESRFALGVIIKREAYKELLEDIEEVKEWVDDLF